MTTCTMRLRNFLPAALAAAFLAGCTGDTPAGPSQSAEAPGPELASAASATTQVPMHGTYKATGSFTTPPAGCAGFYSTFEGGGIETHLGTYTITNDICSLPGDATHSTISGGFTKATASGDLLFGTYTGTTTLTQAPGAGQPIGVFDILGQLTFTGGTGRFAGASGHETMRGTQTTDFSQDGFPSTTTLSLDGTMSSIGSLQRTERAP
jgi:hypothetical protein